jgi:hypothetical protein
VARGEFFLRCKKEKLGQIFVDGKMKKKKFSTLLDFPSLLNDSLQVSSIIFKLINFSPSKYFFLSSVRELFDFLLGWNRIQPVIEVIT